MAGAGAEQHGHVQAAAANLVVDLPPAAARHDRVQHGQARRPVEPVEQFDGLGAPAAASRRSAAPSQAGKQTVIVVLPPTSPASSISPSRAA